LNKVKLFVDTDVFDCVATVFFIDTAHNVIAYIETIYNILKPGGYWINLGKKLDLKWRIKNSLYFLLYLSNEIK
jgi:hypothetical protein